MQILYCEDCGTRVDESESTLVDGKVYCAACAPKAQAAVAATATKSVPRRSARRTSTPGGVQTSGRATPGGGVRAQRPEQGGSSMFGRADGGANGMQNGYAPPVPAWQAWVQQNTALAIALGAGVLGVVIFILWSALSTPPPKQPPKKIEPEVAPSTTAANTTAPTTIQTVTAETRPVSTGITQSLGADFAENNAKEMFQEDIEPLAKKPNLYDYRKEIEDFVNGHRKFKDKDWFKKAEELLSKVPTGARPPDDATGATSGLNVIATFKNVESAYTTDFKPEKTFTMKDISIPDAAELKKRTGHDAYIAMRVTGYLEAPTDGNYTFYLKSDDGSFMRIGDMRLIDYGGNHAMTTEKFASVPLKAGKHRIRVDYYQGMGLAGLMLAWSGPKIDKEPVPASAFTSKK